MKNALADVRETAKTSERGVCNASVLGPQGVEVVHVSVSVVPASVVVSVVDNESYEQTVRDDDRASPIATACRGILARASETNESSKSDSVERLRGLIVTLTDALLVDTDGASHEATSSFPNDLTGTTHCLLDALAAALFSGGPEKNKNGRTKDYSGATKTLSRDATLSLAADAAVFAVERVQGLRFIANPKQQDHDAYEQTVWDELLKAFVETFLNPKRWARALAMNPHSPRTRLACERYLVDFVQRLSSVGLVENESIGFAEHESSVGFTEHDTRVSVNEFRKLSLAADAFTNFARELVGDTTIGCVGQSVVLKAGAALLDESLRCDLIRNDSGNVNSALCCDGDGDGDGTGEPFPERASTLPKKQKLTEKQKVSTLARFLKTACVSRGEWRTLRRVENVMRRCGLG